MLYKDRLKDIRTYEGVMQTELVKVIGISNAAYSEFEREKTIMPIIHLINTCSYFDVSLDYIFSFTEEKTYKNINKNIDVKEAGKRLKEFRKENKLTQIDLKKFLNTTQSAISNYERGRNLIATPFLYTICKKYKISADYLVGRIDSPKYLK